jgi:hypothetical protein
MCMTTATAQHVDRSAAAIRSARRMPAGFRGTPDSYDEPRRCARCEVWSESRKCLNGVCVVCVRELTEAQS